MSTFLSGIIGAYKWESGVFLVLRSNATFEKIREKLNKCLNEYRFTKVSGNGLPMYIIGSEDTEITQHILSLFDGDIKRSGDELEASLSCASIPNGMVFSNPVVYITDVKWFPKTIYCDCVLSVTPRRQSDTSYDFSGVSVGKYFYFNNKRVKTVSNKKNVTK